MRLGYKMLLKSLPWPYGWIRPCAWRSCLNLGANLPIMGINKFMFSLRRCKKKSPLYNRSESIPCAIVFQPGFRGTPGFGEWLPGCSAETDRNCLGRNSQPQIYAVVAIPVFHSCIGFHEQRKHLRKVPMQQKRLKNTALCIKILLSRVAQNFLQLDIDTGAESRWNG